ncbi:MAG: hypothetical protein ACYDCK_07460 [Thermoplasmatota archaeon]
MNSNILQRKLKELVGLEVVVVMTDNRAFRGAVVDFDDETLVLRNVVEGLPNNAGGWEEPTVSTGIVHKTVTWQGTFSHEDTKSEVVRLKDAYMAFSHILRIWEFSTKNTQKPEHVEMAEGSEGPSRPGPATRVSRRS